MPIDIQLITPAHRDRILKRDEDHYTDLKSLDVKPAKLTKHLSAFANAHGGKIYVGIEEHKKLKFRSWRGFPCPEAANGFLQGLQELFPMGKYFSYTFLACPGETGLVLRVRIRRTPDIRFASDRPYVRRGAQSLPVDTDECFREVCESKGLPGVKWRTRKTQRIPLNVSDLFRNLGHLVTSELPDTALAEAAPASLALRSKRLIDQEDARAFLRELWFSGKYSLDEKTFPYLAQWLSQVRLAPSDEAAERERQQLFLFSQAVQGYHEDPDGMPFMPGFTWREISCWRVFVLLFPESFFLLERVLSKPNFWRKDQSQAALLLCSALATGDDERLASNGRDLIRQATKPYLVGQSVGDYMHYAFVRQCFFALAEAEGGQHVQPCLDFLYRHRNSSDNWEIRFQREYYEGTDDIAREALERKLRSGKHRDQTTAAIAEYILGRLSSNTTA